MGESPVRATATRAVVAAFAVVALAASPTLAQVGGAPPSAAGGGGGQAIVARALSPAPLRQSIDVEASRQAGALRQSASSPRSRGRSCALRVAGFTALGAVAGLGAAAILLASTGGSDDTNGILTRWGVLGAAGGAVAGVVSCLAP